tara:strand:- start:673 stop:936 length:264 start_codon:yes stop_codon:yes gene_type:complete
MEVINTPRHIFKEKTLDDLVNTYRTFMESADTSMEKSLLPNWPVTFKLQKTLTNSATISYDMGWMCNTYSISTEVKLRSFLEGILRI